MLSIRSVLTPVLLACIVVCATQRCNAEEDPKSAMMAFAKALQAGEKAAVHDLCVGATDKLKFLDVMIGMMSSVTKLQGAADKKFGVDNAMSKALKTEMPSFAGDVANTEYVVDGNTASPAGKAKPDALKLKKVDGKWKVDLDSRGDGLNDPELTAELNHIAQVCGTLADDINSDKFKTVEEATKALDARMAPTQK